MNRQMTGGECGVQVAANRKNHSLSSSFDMAVADGTARDIDMDAVAQRPFDYEAVITSQKSCLYQIQHEIRHTQGDPCPRTKTGYTGLPPATDPPPATVPKLNEVQETVFSGRKMKLVNWDGVTALPILTKEHRVIAIGAPRPLCPDWDDVHKGAFKKIFDIRNCQAPTNRRGAFSSLNFGFSYGFGHKKPRNRKQSSRHSKVVDALRCDSNVQRLAEAASGESRQLPLLPRSHTIHRCVRWMGA